ncbi:hypothetical protein BV22DRAFT_1047028 [Leucogyrophana mollusca]|uniref:Uncharacterized protein n=1 Tax=Leucogyrophana mollusca TaxID=85980 RepID=A0ACB8BKE3_9AGAM|nr:hypothetical protein BV22DRAFT_1047028 [Leucogyrophana mollusca]
MENTNANTDIRVAHLESQRKKQEDDDGDGDGAALIPAGRLDVNSPRTARRKCPAGRRDVNTPGMAGRKYPDTPFRIPIERHEDAGSASGRMFGAVMGCRGAQWDAVVRNRMLGTQWDAVVRDGMKCLGRNGMECCSAQWNTVIRDGMLWDATECRTRADEDEGSDDAKEARRRGRTSAHTQRSICTHETQASAHTQRSISTSTHTPRDARQKVEMHDRKKGRAWDRREIRAGLEADMNGAPGPCASIRSFAKRHNDTGRGFIPGDGRNSNPFSGRDSIHFHPGEARCHSAKNSPARQSFDKELDPFDGWNSASFDAEGFFRREEQCKRVGKPTNSEERGTRI